MNDTKYSNDDDLICPITLELFHDPVRASDGHVYERKAITRWIQQHGTSPFTREILHIEELSSEKNLKKLAAQRRNSTISDTISIETIKLPSNCHLTSNQRNAIVHPSESVRIQQSLIHNSDCEKRSWAAIFLMIITMCGVLCISLLLIITKQGSNRKIKYFSENISNSCLPISRVTTLLRLINVTQFNYTYYTYLYRAMTSNDTIVFSFQHDSSYWCLDDLSLININSKAKLIHNGDFESGILKPFYFCSKYNYTLPNLSRNNSNQHSGMYAFCHKSISYVSHLIQNLNTTKGQIYNISFWIKNQGGPINKLHVSMIT